MVFTAIRWLHYWLNYLTTWLGLYILAPGNRVIFLTVNEPRIPKPPGFGPGPSSLAKAAKAGVGARWELGWTNCFWFKKNTFCVEKNFTPPTARARETRTLAAVTAHQSRCVKGSFPPFFCARVRRCCCSAIRLLFVLLFITLRLIGARAVPSCGGSRALPGFHSQQRSLTTGFPLQLMSIVLENESKFSIL